MSARWGRRWGAVLVSVFTAVGVTVSHPAPAVAAAFVVTTGQDRVDANPGDGTCLDAVGDCTLRAALMEANALPGEDTITLAAGTYRLSIPGADEDAAATGDFDVLDSVTIAGAGAGATVIRAEANDRLLQVHPGATLTLSGVTVRDGDIDRSTNSREGGGIFNEGTAILTAVVVTNNRVATLTDPARGGGIASTGYIEIRDSVIDVNEANATAGGGAGGGLYHSGTALITGTTFSDNQAKGSLGVMPFRGARGGAIYSDGALIFRDGDITGNEAFDDATSQAQALGGAVFASADATIVRSTLALNRAEGQEGSSVLTNAKVRGGAVAVTGLGHDLTIDRVTFHANEASVRDDGEAPVGGTANGGAIHTEQLANLFVVNSTLSGNSAETTGGAVYHAGLDASYSNTTVTLNVAVTGGGLGGSGMSFASNSIFSGNLAGAGPDCKGSIDSLGFNLLGDTAGCTLEEAIPTSLVDVDPMLGPLADNGGPTLTHAVPNLSPAAGEGSPAVPGSGSGACEPTDQRGVERPVGARCDIGAYESGFLSFVPMVCNGLDATIHGTDGDDTLVGTPGADVIAGGPGNDVLIGGGGDDVICGGDGDDQLWAGSGNDTLFGDAGADLLRGADGDDESFGGPGEDRLQDGPGADVLWGGDDNDKLWGGNGNDELHGDAGNDQLHGNRDDDVLEGGSGTDRMWGDSGSDTLSGGPNSDFLYGGIDVDVLNGGAGNDRLFGWTGNDELFGNAGRDQLRGQAGDDLVDGGAGSDFCSVETVMVACEIDI
jgi:CSLREA domain-containing protein